MKIIRVTYFALGAFVFAASCSKEAAEPDVYDWADGEVYFKTSLSDVASSRAQDMTLDRLESFQVTCFNTGDPTKDASGIVSPYFEDATFVRQNHSNGSAYVSSPAEGPREWPAKSGLLRFFAFSPSITVMRDGNALTQDADKDTHFNLVNTSNETQSTVAVGYRLANMRINPDIASQFDFVTAEAAGERWKDFAGGVELAFNHRLCQVELKAWGDASNYDFEITGVRLGNPVVEGSFVFADDSAPQLSLGWEVDDDGLKDKVEYVYRPADTSGREGHAGDRIFKISSTEHNTPETAASLMGNGGCAMVIPTLNARWEGLGDPNIGNIPYSTERMYFSILTRVTDHSSGNLIYPYPDKPAGMTVISFAIDEEDNILARLYYNRVQARYFTDPELQNPYVVPNGVEIKDFGWAAVPVDADWAAGKRYVYTLNYSEGIGLHVPEDPEPGKPIAGKEPSITWGVNVETWIYAEKDEDYEPDLDVPEE